MPQCQRHLPGKWLQIRGEKTNKSVLFKKVKFLLHLTSLSHTGSVLSINIQQYSSSQYLEIAVHVDHWSLPPVSFVKPRWPCPAFSFNFFGLTSSYGPLRRWRRRENTSKCQPLIAIGSALRFLHKMKKRQSKAVCLAWTRWNLPPRCWSTPASTPPRQLDLNPIGKSLNVKMKESAGIRVLGYRLCDYPSQACNKSFWMFITVIQKHVQFREWIVCFLQEWADVLRLLFFLRLFYSI